MVYQFRDGSRVTGVDAQTAGEELDRIQVRDGKIEAPVVVEEARPSDAPLHPAFEWNNKMAAEQYRLQQARHLIRAVHVIVEENGKAHAEPEYVSVQPVAGEDRYYQNVRIALNNPDEWESALKEATRYTESVIRSLEALRKLATGKPRKTIRSLKTASESMESAKAAIAGIGK
jgi:hypothetical protein